MNAPAWLVAVCATACLTLTVSAATVSAPSSSWTVLSGNYDYLADQQTGQPAGDIVGSGTNGGFFTTFNDNGSASNTDGTLGFRLRLDAAGGNKNNIAFDRVAWVGIDANNDAVLDAFIGLGMQGSSSTLGIYAPGTDLNTSPATTSVASTAYKSYSIDSSNYNYRPVDYTTDGGTTNDATTSTTGDPDYYLSFMVNFRDLVNFLGTKGISITDQSGLRYVVATSTQMNSLNQDLGGVNGGVNSPTSWSDLGGFSPTVSAHGTPVPAVPEPSAFFLGASSVLLACLRRRRA
ncbi:hypothetical protein [Luteolibacter luteus]|uniref:PEP-CTERM sorting domain-containing protein n=1 Tax=Luteolibacter luteus TaxID=2728835 RepID=A0A858RH92_9BACT|nr:hypothetical protein [Luteolibacter luteus]QJE96075.1 hypothetical protein HHL09_09850 [Luteolibacter luteus]